MRSWHAAVWYGGARAVARPLLNAPDPHALAHLGAVDVALTSARGALERAADEVDADPLDRKATAATRALRVRALVARVAAEVLDRTGAGRSAPGRCPTTRHWRPSATARWSASACRTQGCARRTSPDPP